MEEKSDTYVCITHLCVTPCLYGKYHLVSNWPGDVRKIMDR